MLLINLLPTLDDIELPSSIEETDTPYLWHDSYVSLFEEMSANVIIFLEVSPYFCLHLIPTK